MQTRTPRLTEASLAHLRRPSTGERTVWCGALPRFGVRLRAGGRAKIFVLKYRGPDGRQRKMTLGSWPSLSVDGARRLARQHLGDVARGLDPAAERQADRDAPTMADLAVEYMTIKRATKRPSSLRDDRAMWDAIILPVVGKRRVKSITSRDVETLHKSREATPYRANRVLALLSNAFSLAVRWSWCGHNPARGIERFHEDRRERYLKPDELARLVEGLNDHLNRRAANAVRLLLLTGARRSEVLSATWDQFDLEAGVWTKPSSHTKQKHSHRVPLSAPVRALLATMRTGADQADVPSSFLFPGDALGKPLGDIKTFWRSVCAQAELRGVRLHDLRHQYASMLASAGLSLTIIGRLLGHTQPATTARYAHLFDDPLRQATDRVGVLIEQAGKAGADVVPMRQERT